MTPFDMRWEWEAGEGVRDAVERNTWARLTWLVDGIEVTRARDRIARAEREAIIVPLFPLVCWLVENWWSFLYEPRIMDSLPEPGASMDPEVREWLLRHNMRTAATGFALPFATLFSEGKDVAVAWSSDPAGHYKHVPVEFTASGRCVVPRDSVSSKLTELIESVLGRFDGVADARVDMLKADWRAICDGRGAEAEICRAAGRLGLDPYNTAAWPQAALAWLEGSELGELDGSLATDMLETPDAVTVGPALYARLRDAARQLRLGPAPTGPAPIGRSATRAFEEGYQAATRIRQHLSLADDDPLEDLSGASTKAVGWALTPRHDDSMFGGSVGAIVGWAPNPGPVIVTRGQLREDRQRFMLGRGLYLALNGMHEGPRLVTEARVWDQRASRAFSAELLAPRLGVAGRYHQELKVTGDEDESEERVAQHYRVSRRLIGLQLENAHRRLTEW